MELSGTGEPFLSQGHAMLTIGVAMRCLWATAGILATALMLPGGQAAAEPAPGFVTSNTNLWTGPSTDYPPVRALPEGGRLTIEGCLEGRGWCDVSFEDARGWVPGSDIAYETEGRRVPLPELGNQVPLPTVPFSLTGYWDSHYRNRPWYADRDKWASRYAGPPPAQMAATPVATVPPPAAPPPPPAAPVAASGPPQPGYITGNVNVRAEPSTAYPRVSTLPVGATVTIHGCLEGWTWCDVAYGDLRGWVAGTYVTSEYQGQRVGVVDYGPRLALPIVTFAFTNYWDSYYRGRPWYAQRARWARYPYHAGPRYYARPHYVAPRYVHRPYYGYHYRPYVDHRPRHWDRGPHYRPQPRYHVDQRRFDHRQVHRGWDRRPDRHHGRGGPRGYSGGQTERDAARFNRQRRGPMRGE